MCSATVHVEIHVPLSLQYCSPASILVFSFFLQYIAFETNTENEVYITTRRAARNMAFQGFTPQDGVVNVLLELVGQVGLMQKIAIHMHCIRYLKFLLDKCL